MVALEMPRCVPFTPRAVSNLIFRIVAGMLRNYAPSMGSARRAAAARTASGPTEKPRWQLVTRRSLARGRALLFSCARAAVMRSTSFSPEREVRVEVRTGLHKACGNPQVPRGASH